MITLEEIKNDLQDATRSYMSIAADALSAGLRSEAKEARIQADLCSRLLEEWFGESVTDTELQDLHDYYVDYL